jgi:hypothetical protein
LDSEGAVLVPERAGVSAVGARWRGAEVLGLLLQEGGEGALGQAGGGGGGDLLQGVHIEVEAGARVAEGSAGDDFAPPGGQFTDILELLGRDRGVRHGSSCLVLAKNGSGAFLLPFYRAILCLAKRVLASAQAVC